MTGQNVGQVELDLLLNSKGFKTQLEGAVNKAVSQTSTSISGSVSSSFGKMGKLALAAFSVKALIGFSKSAIELGSDLQEVQNVVDSTFTTMSADVDAFAASAIRDFGLSELVAKRYMGTLGAMSKSFGFTEEKAYEMSKTLTGLVGDVASFYNLSSEQAFTKLKSVFTGETESLKDLGVVMTQTALDEFALANGYGKTTAAMTEQEKVALRYKFVLKRLQTASGDFIRTQDGWANQMRILNLQWESFKANIGQAFIAVLTPVIKMLNLLLSKLVAVSLAFKNFIERIFHLGKKPSGSGGTGELADEIEQMGDSLGGAAAAAKKVHKSLLSIDQLHILSEDPDIGGTGGGGGIGGLDIDIDQKEEDTEKTEELNKELSNFEKTMLRIKEMMKKGFFDVFGDSNMDIIKQHIQELKKEISNIITDEDVQKASNIFLDKMAYMVGTLGGLMSKAGNTVAELFFGGISNFFKSYSKHIKKDIIDTFDITGDIAELMSKFAKTIGEFLEVYKTEFAKSALGEFLGIIYNLGRQVLGLALRLIRDVLGVFIKPIIKNSEKIKKLFNTHFKLLSRLFKFVGRSIRTATDILLKLYDVAIAPIFSVLEKGLTFVLGLIIDIMDQSEKSISFILGLLVKMQTALYKVLEWLKEMFDRVKIILTNLIDFITGWFKSKWDAAWTTMKAFFCSIWDSIKSYFVSKWTEIGDFFNTKITWIKDMAHYVFQNIKNYFYEKCQEISNRIHSISTYAHDILEWIKTVAKNAFTSIKNYFAEKMDNIRVKAYNSFMDVKNYFSDRIENMKSAWSSFKDWITSVASSISTKIKDAFTTMKNNVVSVFSGLSSAIKSPLNAVIGLINRFISKLNNFSFTIPSWVPGIGGKHFGFHISSLPMLAQGAYVKANTPQLAMIGDNRHEGEIVAPESKIKEAVAAGNAQMISAIKALIATLAENNFSGNRGQVVIPITIDGEVIDQYIVDLNNSRVIRGG